jgi:hypothetical protein
MAGAAELLLKLQRVDETIVKKEDQLKATRVTIGEELGLYTPPIPDANELGIACTNPLEELEQIATAVGEALGTGTSRMLDTICTLSENIEFLTDECRERMPVVNVEDLPDDLQEFIRAYEPKTAERGWFIADDPPPKILGFVQERVVELKQPLVEIRATIKRLKEERDRTLVALCGEDVAAKGAKGGELPDKIPEPGKAKNSWLFIRLCYTCRPSWRQPLRAMVAATLSPDHAHSLCEAFSPAPRPIPNDSGTIPEKVLTLEVKTLWSFADRKLKDKFKNMFDTWREETKSNFPLPDFPDEWRVDAAET